MHISLFFADFVKFLIIFARPRDPQRDILEYPCYAGGVSEGNTHSYLKLLLDPVWDNFSTESKTVL